MEDYRKFLSLVFGVYQDNGFGNFMIGVEVFYIFERRGGFLMEGFLILLMEKFLVDGNIYIERVKVFQFFDMVRMMEIFKGFFEVGFEGYFFQDYNFSVIDESEMQSVEDL